MASNPDDVAKAFLQYYYGLFSTNRAGLANLYQPQSLMTFEGTKFQGAEAIIGKFSSLAFQKCQVQPDTVDVQPSISSGILIFVTGKLLPDGEQMALKFSQTFHLMPTPNGSFIITNDMFRLNYG